ncbi:hypothetical protein GWK47_001603 [Chionoecetes opilio]|uniref:Secreted protein n=1 Tax=Chionoecetes opilio TaxID=41210 RepID=A0A8J4XT46_CHIOP|nr:hypothetical protein GWK47_001603 [Chionoecetes opilio]
MTLNLARLVLILHSSSKALILATSLSVRALSMALDPPDGKRPGTHRLRTGRSCPLPTTSSHWCTGHTELGREHSLTVLLSPVGRGGPTWVPTLILAVRSSRKSQSKRSTGPGSPSKLLVNSQPYSQPATQPATQPASQPDSAPDSQRGQPV